ncbi:MAG: iron-containing alcohol dehydrogenase [Sphaerochaetaceae bacterium]|nr:iron-containing alcohol dehydrogenase [Sphaerochaetaceae bacterium]
MKKPTEYNFKFQGQTQMAIGPEVLMHLPKFLTMQGISQPFWIFPKPLSERRFLQRKLTKVLREIPADATAVGPLLNENELLQLADCLRNSSFDSLIVGGDADTITLAKIVAILAKKDNEITVSQALETIKADEDIETLPLIVIPFGVWDGNECQGRFMYQEKVFENLAVAPRLALFDGRFTRRTTLQAITHTMYTALLQIFTALYTSQNPMLLSMAETALYSARQTLEAIISTTKSRKSWTSVTLFAAATLHAAGLCSQNSGKSAIVACTESLASPNFATKHQNAIAILPYLLELIEQTDPLLYRTIKGMLSGIDPQQFVNAWETLNESATTVKTIRLLYQNSYTFLTSAQHLRELRPLLTLMSTRRGSV